jgi:hypothetical protein
MEEKDNPYNTGFSVFSWYTGELMGCGLKLFKPF